MSAQRSTIVVLVVTGGVALGLHDASPAAPARSGTTAQAAVAHAAAAVCDRDSVVVIGHRGTGPGTRTVHGRPYSEDTIEAFDVAVRSGADGFETDFWPTVDGEVVSHHDATATRMTDGTGPIWSHTLDEVRELRHASGARVPTFREILRATVPAHPGVHLQQESRTAGCSATRCCSSWPGSTGSS